MKKFEPGQEYTAFELVEKVDSFCGKGEFGSPIILCNMIKDGTLQVVESINNGEPEFKYRFVAKLPGR